MSLNLKANCYGFATGCHKFCFFPVGCRKPKKLGKHCCIPSKQKLINFK